MPFQSCISILSISFDDDQSKHHEYNIQQVNFKLAAHQRGCTHRAPRMHRHRKNGHVPGLAAPLDLRHAQPTPVTRKTNLFSRSACSNWGRFEVHKIGIMYTCPKVLAL